MSPFQKMLDGADESLLMVFMPCLANLKGEASAEILLRMIRSPSEQVRKEALRSMIVHRIWVQQAQAPLLDDENRFIRQLTVRYLVSRTHSVNVAVLSLCLGNRIGLPRNSLVHLGICGLFHDLGKIDVSREILKKAGQLTEDEWVEMKKHGFGGHGSHPSNETAGRITRAKLTNLVHL